MRKQGLSRRRPPSSGAVAGAPRVFLDSGIFIALLDRSDSFHDAATQLFAGPRPRWCTSVAVVGECYGWFLHRLNEHAARTFRLALDDLPGLTLLPIDQALHRATTAKLEQHRGRKLCYVDAASLVLLREHAIGTVWGTDAHLTIEGARLLPEG